VTFVFLRPLELHRDVPALHQVFGDEKSCLYLTCSSRASVDETYALLKPWFDQCPETEWALIDQVTDNCLGRITMVPRGDAIYEAACVVIPKARGRGLACKGLQEAIDFIFDHRNARRVVAEIDPDNIASIKTFERLGFLHEGVHRAALKTHIGVRDSLIMGLLSSDPRPWHNAANAR